MAHSSADIAGQRAARIAAAARSWIGTPYHHQASLRGVGCDCLGLLRGVWREVVGPEPRQLPAYSADWGDVTGVKSLLNAVKDHFEPVPVEAADIGDVLVFRMRPGRVAKHCGIVVAKDGTARSFVHAWEATPVTECALSPWWAGRVVAAFRYPPEGGA